ncbi:hypothetical protein [Petroclostridium sp. X23]|uniref:hypothetical protein n=1 Tax=Petroclostridium sp. X23 TaxID=3045146 RepID=UPI0024AE73B5|nr:hypothetical protein [Petroclostridium sp. X23]WHH58081.1 hypothetical protein QKW49_20085 [Petroclostridium sp. X23]
MRSFKQKIDEELHDTIFDKQLKRHVLEKSQKHGSKLNKFLNREIEIPLTPAIAVCLAVMIAWSAGVGNLEVGGKEIQQSKIKVISMQTGVEQNENH